MTTYPYGYQADRVTIEQLRSKSTFARLTPEFRRRVEAIIVASNGALGIGTGYRSPASQDAERARRLQTGQGAPMAPSAKSWHCNGYAVDFVGDLGWFGEHAAAFGILQADWSGERWHGQPIEVPHARPAGASPPLAAWDLPGSTPVPQPHPPATPDFPPFDPARCLFSLWPLASKPWAVIGTHHESVKYLQGVLACRGQHITAFDGVYGPQTQRAVVNLQRFFGLATDGKVGPQTWAVVDQLAST